MSTQLDIDAGAPDLGPCCACRRDDGTVRNMMMLRVKTPEPGGTAWGCAVCGLASEGACAVLCDDCMMAGRKPIEVIAGFAAEKRRLPIERCIEPHRHDLAFHPEVEDDKRREGPEARPGSQNEDAA